jgi:hypothetical protein
LVRAELDIEEINEYCEQQGFFTTRQNVTHREVADDGALRLGGLF